ncbi:ABC transporter permease subunit [Escherichia coli]|nr:ABC transporter permease subunit [Escherichia coli]EFG8700797.1 ABC transporter permease subunit [Escherichia coli]
MKKMMIATLAAASVLLAVANQAHAGATLDAVQKKGFVQCGISDGLPGFSYADADGKFSGIDVDVCRGVAAAVFGDDTKVKYTPLTAKERFTALQSGEVDLLSRNTTWTSSRDAGMGMAFTGVTYYDGIGFLTHDKAGLKSAKELDGATVCIQAGTDTELNVADYFKANNMKYTPVTFDRSDESAKALESGRCDTLASDQSQLYALRIKLSNPAEWIVLPEVISKEPLGPVVRRGDDEWFSIVRWTLFAMLNAEEMGINSQNVDEKAANPATPDMAHLLGVVGIVGWLFHNTVTNLSNRGITSGFAFLDRGAGFGIVQHLIDYQQGDTYGRVFIVGLLNTLLVSALCIVFASVLGFFIGLARLSDNWLLRKLSTIYIEIFRNIPPLLQIFFWYFAVLRNLPGPRQAVSAFDLAFLSNRGLYIPSPQLGDGFIAFILAVVMAIVLSVGLFRFNKTYQIKTGQLRRTWPIAAVLIIGLPLLAQWLFGAALHWDVPALRGFNFRGGMVLIPELAALTLALSVYTSAFIAEIIRAGIQAVPYGQHEAARSLGLPNPVTLRQVIIPQALRVIIPPLTSQYLNIVKNSSLAAAIGYPDMVSLFAGTVLNQTGQAIETIAMTMSVYLIISLTISLLMNIYNRRIAIVER